MLTIYPSNRLEDLAILLAELIKIRPKPVLAATTILVPNPGMQHWLNMYIADYLGVSMNIECPMPTRYIWDLCREVLGDGSVPKQSPFKRDILCWKIFTLAQSEAFTQTSFYNEVSLYWQQAETETEKKLRIFSFARQLADLFEQYLVFRPDWLLKWEQQQSQHFSQAAYQKFEKWQQWFWNEIVNDFPEHPVSLQYRAIEALSLNKQNLPADIYIFSISSISPIYLQFFDEIGQHTQVHLFQLNPCVNYWGDAKSDLVVAKMMRKQSMQASLIEEDLHPLLKNLGQQGRDLNNLLLEMRHQEIAAFDIVDEQANFNLNQQKENKGQRTLLQYLQTDILNSETSVCSLQHDGSIAVHACHSPVRELQVLKDALLSKFAENNALEPKDVLVMCPSIEKYSPYIQSIFTQSSQANLNIPVSISDRKPIESEPFLVAFNTLLSLPLSRFDATSIIDLISLPAIANKYKLSTAEIDLCARWTKDACIDWGMDAKHVSKILSSDKTIELDLDENTANIRHAENVQSTEQLHNLYTWQWGVNRLLTGILNAFEDLVIDNIAPINYVEGQANVVLGRFMQMLEDIEQNISLLSQSLPLHDWSQLLLEIVNDSMLATESDKFAMGLLKEAIVKLENNSVLANFSGNIELPTLLAALQNLLNIPEVRSQFHTGNMTFCSMLPMRSIPFKVIAILGLNQRDFPRQDNPVEIDLMQASDVRTGDRSRRGDDRYLFLETIVSAREYLHLSYQYRHVKTNSERMPSTVLQMLIEHCQETYSKASLPIIEHALHPFSLSAFTTQKGYKGSYDKAWWQQLNSIQQANAVNTPTNQATNKFLQNVSADLPLVINQQQIVKFLKGSLQYFANNHLKIYLEMPQKRDYSPSYQLHKGIQYALRADAQTLIRQDQLFSQHHWDILRKHWLLSGELPFLIGIESDLQRAYLDIMALQQTLVVNNDKQRAKGSIQFSALCIEYDFEYSSTKGIIELKLNRGEPRLNHMISAWIQLLILLVHKESNEHQQQLDKLDEASANSANIYYIADDDEGHETRDIKCTQINFVATTNAYDALEKVLNVFVLGNQQPLLLDLPMASDILAHGSMQKALLSTSLKVRWQDCAEQGQDENSYFPHLYFNYLMLDMPEFNESSINPYFSCFGNMHISDIEPIPFTFSSADVANILLDVRENTYGI